MKRKCDFAALPKARLKMVLSFAAGQNVGSYVFEDVSKMYLITVMTQSP